MGGRTDEVHGFVTALRFHLSHHPPDVVLHRKFRQVQASGTFLVRAALRDKMHQLQLAVRQAVLVSPYTVAIFGFQSVFARDMKRAVETCTFKVMIDWRQFRRPSGSNPDRRRKIDVSQL